MRTFSRIAVTLATAGGLLVALTAPATAAVTSCPGGEPVCLYVPAGSYPVGNPVNFTNGTTMSYVELPRVCNSSGTECLRTFVAVPGVWVDSNASTVATLDFPGLGIGINGTQVTLYADAPTVTPGGTGLGLTVTVSEDMFVVTTSDLVRECDTASDTVGPLTASRYGCVLTLTLKV